MKPNFAQWPDFYLDQRHGQLERLLPRSSLAWPIKRGVEADPFRVTVSTEGSIPFTRSIDTEALTKYVARM